MPTWSTGVVPPRRQFTYWREMICEAFLDLTPESAARDGFRGRVRQRRLRRIAIAQIDSQAQRVRRTESDIARSPMVGHYANMQVRGTSLTIQDGRATVMHPGDITVIDTSRPFTFEFSDDFEQVSLHLPGDLLGAQVVQPIRTATRITTVSGVGAAIRHALHALDRGGLRPDAASRLAMHTAGLLAVELDRPERTEPGARRHPRLLEAALEDIEEHLADDDLSPATTARRLGISARLLHQLFAGREQTFAREVRRRRLEQAARDLRDPARSSWRIIDIAAEVGFADVTHFHRAFKDVYGRTPADIRRAAGITPQR